MTDQQYIQKLEEAYLQRKESGGSFIIVLMIVGAIAIMAWNQNNKVETVVTKKPVPVQTAEQKTITSTNTIKAPKDIFK